MVYSQKNRNNSAEVLFQSNGNKNLLISFGGIRMGMGMPVFEFYNSLKGLECDKVFVKDIKQSWYHKGIIGNDSDIYEVAGYLRDIINENEYKNVCFIGNSMGGYAAILFGAILNIPNIIAFSPQTFMDKKNRFFYNDKRWKDELKNVYNYPKKGKIFFDLKKYFNNLNFNYDGKIDIYYSTLDKLDRIHAERLHKFDFINLHSHPFGGHGLVKELKNTGELKKIFSRIFK